MNWMGGARARARKEGVVQKQKAYFAKKRAAEAHRPYMGSSPSPAVVDSAGRKRKQALLDFDIVVGQQDKENRPLAKKLLGSEGEEGGEEDEIVEVPKPKRRKSGGQEGDSRERTEKEKIKVVKEALLKKRDWVSTMKIPALQRPIAKPKPKERIAPFRLPRETPVSSSRPRASQTITETPTDVRDHPDTDFNAHLLLGDGGYIRFGRGRPEANHSMDAYVPHCPSHSRVSDPFGLNSRTDRQEREVYEQSTPRGSSHFQSVQSSPPRSMSSRTERRNRELDEQRLQSTPREGSYFQSVQSSAPRSMNFRELFPDGHPIGPPRAGARLLSRQVAADFHTSQAYEDTDAEVDYGSFLPRRNRVEQWPLSHSQSSPTTHIGHYVSQEIDREYIVVDEDEYEEIFAEESELPDSINPSAMAHASSSNDTLRHENEEQSGFNGTFLGTPPPENTEKNWMVFLNASPVRGSQENQDGISTFVHGRTVTETEVNDDPTQPFFGSEALGEQVDALDGPSDDTPVDEDERPVTSVPRKVDNDATWKKFLTASTEVTSRNALTLNALDISGDLNMLSAPKTPIPESPPARLSPTRDVNRAWHAFILPTYPDSDDDEDYAPKSLDGRQYTALTSTQNAGSLSMSTGPISLPRLPSRSPKGPSRPSPSTNTEKAVAESVMAHASSSQIETSPPSNESVRAHPSSSSQSANTPAQRLYQS